MRNKLASLFQQAGGNVTVLFAVSVVPVLLAAGSAIDYMRYNDARTSVQAALDGAALAAATPEGITDAERKAVGEGFFKNNLSYNLPNGEDIEVTIAVNADSVVASVNTLVPTSFMRLGGIETLVVDEVSEVMRPFKGTAEIAMVLDYSGSMNDKNKYSDMAAAATKMIQTLDDALDDGKLKVGMVPFSAMVYTSMDKSYVNQASATQTWVGCTQDRKYPYNTNVDTPTSDPNTKWGYIDGNGENNGKYGCVAYNTKKLNTIPLTTNMPKLITKLSEMKPLGNTNISLGTEFGWNLLDPQLPYDEAAPYTDSQTRKFLVLLTDGVQTSSEFGSGSKRSIANANNNLIELCTSIRKKGITVFAIAYDVSDPKVTDLLKSCAPGRYFEPDAGGGEINKVFTQITKQIKNRVARVAK